MANLPACDSAAAAADHVERHGRIGPYLAQDFRSRNRHGRVRQPVYRHAGCQYVRDGVPGQCAGARRGDRNGPADSGGADHRALSALGAAERGRTMSVQAAVPLSTPAPWISRTTQRRVLRVVVYGLLIFFAILFLVPVYMVLVTSFKSLDQVSLSTMWN